MDLVDAITHKGPALASRVHGAHPCARPFVGHLSTAARRQQIAALNSRIIGNIIAAPRLQAEPRVTLGGSRL